MAQPLLSPSERAVVYPVPRWSASWAIPAVPVPESDTHDAAVEWLRALLSSWVERTGRDVKVARNLGIRWVQEEPRFGFDPDLCLIEPAPDRHQPLHSLRLWLPGHPAPLLAVEVVSPGHPYKDYVDTPERCAACGVQELWVYDPLLKGPRSHGGPHLLQLWRQREGSFERIAAGEDAIYSPLLHAWLHPQPSRLPSGAKVYISDDAAGRERWLTAEERAQRDTQRALQKERQAKESERQAKESERQAKERERHARESEQLARENERRARDDERRAREDERRARELLEREQRERAELQARLHELERRSRRE